MDCDCGSKSIGFVTSVNGQTGDITIKEYKEQIQDLQNKVKELEDKINELMK